jgi:hypothetical protein
LDKFRRTLSVSYPPFSAGNGLSGYDNTVDVMVQLLPCVSRLIGESEASLDLQKPQISQFKNFADQKCQ